MVNYEKFRGDPSGSDPSFASFSGYLYFDHSTIEIIMW